MRIFSTSVAVLAVLVAGCSGDDASSGTSAGVVSDPSETTSTSVPVVPDPCSLVTVAEVAQLLDRPVAESTSETFADAALCTLSSTEPSSVDREWFPTVTIGLIHIGEANPGNRQRLDEVLALGSTDARELVDFDGVGAFRICEDSAAASAQACDAWDEFVLVYDSFYLEVNMTNYAWPDDYERDRVAEIVEAVATAVAARV